jgi:hypothetical protein
MVTPGGERQLASWNEPRHRIAELIEDHLNYHPAPLLGRTADCCRTANGQRPYPLSPLELRRPLFDKGLGRLPKILR